LIDEKMTKAQMTEDTKFKVRTWFTNFSFQQIKDQISKLIEGIQTEQMSRELLDERKSKELKLSENNI
jgi:hypothetical protein